MPSPPPIIIDDGYGQDRAKNAVELGFSFAGGGWLMCYHFGVAKALRESHAHHTSRFIGTSAGALAAIGLVLDVDFDAICATVTSSYVPRAHATWRGPFQMRAYLIHALTSHANLDAFARCNFTDPHKCTVVYTSLSAWKARKKSTFESPAHLLRVLIASCCATPLVGMPFELDGEWVMDGGLLENQPVFEDRHRVQRTVNVSPNYFDRNAEIRPSQYVPPWWSMYPPSAEQLQWVFRLGYHDGHVWSQREGFPHSTMVASSTDETWLSTPVALGADAHVMAKTTTTTTVDQVTMLCMWMAMLISAVVSLSNDIVWIHYQSRPTIGSGNHLIRAPALK